MGNIAIDTVHQKLENTSISSVYEELPDADMKTYPFSGLITSGSLKQKTSTHSFEAKSLDRMSEKLEQNKSANSINTNSLNEIAAIAEDELCQDKAINEGHPAGHLKALPFTSGSLEQKKPSHFIDTEGTLQSNTPIDEELSPAEAKYLSELSAIVTDELRQDKAINEIFETFERKYPQMNSVNILLLFFECMQLIIKSQREEKRSRSSERLYALERGERVSKEYKSQASWNLIGGVIGGVTSIAASLIPVAGRLQGEKLIGFFGNYFSSLNKYRGDADALFKNVGKMAYSISEMQKVTGQIQNAHSESHRNREQIWSETHKDRAQDNTQSNQEYQDEWRSAANFLLHVLQMDYEAAKANN